MRIADNCVYFVGLMTKVRLDTLIIKKRLAESRNKAQALIMAGKVRVDGSVVTKAGTQIPTDAEIEIEEVLPYVSRGGLKLEKALDTFRISPNHLICADVGASTGGFTDVLLQRGAACVYAIDVGYGQLAWKLRQNDRVIVIERTNARHLEHLPQLIDFVTIDVSFISLKLILPAVKKWLARSASIVALVKPQFEAGRDQVGKGGVVRDRAIHRQVLENIVNDSVESGFSLLGLIPSPITGPAGNREFLLYLGWNIPLPSLQVAITIKRCLATLDEPIS